MIENFEPVPLLKTEVVIPSFFTKKREKVSKKAPSKICARKPLPNFIAVLYIGSKLHLVYF